MATSQRCSETLGQACHPALDEQQSVLTREEPLLGEVDRPTARAERLQPISLVQVPHQFDATRSWSDLSLGDSDDQQAPLQDLPEYRHDIKWWACFCQLSEVMPKSLPIQLADGWHATLADGWHPSVDRVIDAAGSNVIAWSDTALCGRVTHWLDRVSQSSAISNMTKQVESTCGSFATLADIANGAVVQSWIGQLRCLTDENILDNWLAGVFAYRMVHARRSIDLLDVPPCKNVCIEMACRGASQSHSHKRAASEHACDEDEVNLVSHAVASDEVESIDAVLYRWLHSSIISAAGNADWSSQFRKPTQDLRQKSKQCHAKATSCRTKAPIVVRVQLSGRRVGTCRMLADETAKDAAARFIYKHSLDASYRGPLRGFLKAASKLQCARGGDLDVDLAELRWDHCLFSV